ncbi:unnamed protein product [Ranitomeya imitator]|uniref:Uncharacterized protein n=1 Tax=Ranitomeya imitator TaxID=111125 RepID=A0ABN9L0S3_9NEOB|nr:unnamed protein product [Ranitomeya imitator]
MHIFYQVQLVPYIHWLTHWQLDLTWHASHTLLVPSPILYWHNLLTNMKCSGTLFLAPITLAICQPVFHLKCLLLTSSKLCTLSLLSCRGWQWNNSGYMVTPTCTVGIYPARKIITEFIKIDLCNV